LSLMPRRFKWMSESQKTKDLHHRGRAPSVVHFDEENLGRQTDALHRAIYESIVSFNGFGRGINDVRNVGNVLRIYTIDYKAMDSESAPLI